MIFSLKAIGAQALVSSLRKGVKEPVAEGLRKITLKMEAFTKKSTPVDTGRLRASVTSEVSGDIGTVGTNVSYAPFIEYGTAKMEARHVAEGSSGRIFGKGPFTKGLELLHKWFQKAESSIARAIEVGFK